MSTLERLKNLLERCAADGEYVHIEFLIEAWNHLPKLVNVADTTRLFKEQYLNAPRECYAPEAVAMIDALEVLES